MVSSSIETAHQTLAALIKFFTFRPTAEGTKGPNYCDSSATFDIGAIEVCAGVVTAILAMQTSGLQPITCLLQITKNQPSPQDLVPRLIAEWTNLEPSTTLGSFW